MIGSARGRAAALLAALATLLVPAVASGQDDPSPTLSPYRFAKVPGAKLGYRVAGEGRPLVLISGFGLTAAEWDPALIGRLARDRRVIVFDNRGVATSTGSLKRLRFRVMAEDTANLIRALGLRRADVLGWSMGGDIAQELALRHPKVVRRLVLAAADPGGKHAVQPPPYVIRLLSDPDTGPDELLPILFPSDAQEAGYAWYERIGTQPGLLPDSFTTTPQLVAAQTKANARFYRSGRGTWKRLPQLAPPTLVTDGSEDVVAPPRNSRMLSRRIPGARLRIFPGAGHAFLIQEQAEFAPIVRRFLGR